MTNTQIPYSFTPGSKAKAQEVNANFIALAEGIDTAKEYTTNEVAKANTKFDDKALTLANKNLDNVTRLSNCILESPNGDTSYEGDQLFVKKGLKVFLPDGRNEDGSLKSIEYTLDRDITLTNPDMYPKYWYMTQEGVYPVDLYRYTVGTIENIPDGLIWVAYDPDKNMTYIRETDTGAFHPAPLTIVAKTDTDYLSTNITGVSMHKSYELIKRTDLRLVNSVVETYVNGASWYRVYQDGWIEQGARITQGPHTAIGHTLIKAFSNADYNIIVSQGGWNDPYTRSDSGVCNIQPTYFTYGTSSGADSKTRYYACGY